MSDYSTQKPTESGWYDVIWEPGGVPMRVWITVGEHGLTWGWTEYDDPESVDLDVEDPGLIQYRRADAC